MPTFDFQCSACGLTFEYSRPFGSTKLPACPACKSKKVQKLLSTPTIHFRGEGFYKTDSRKAPPAPTPKKEEKKKEEKPAEAAPKKEAEGKKKSTDEKKQA